MVRAKFKVAEITRGTSQRKSGKKSEKGYDLYEPCEIQTIVLRPVYSEDPNSENKKFWDATPTGEIRLGVINQEAWSAFELDKEYYVDFTKA